MNLLSRPAAAAVIAVLPFLVACGSDSDSSSTSDATGPDLVTTGTLTICTDAPYKPFEYPDSSAASGYTGFDMEIIDAIAANLDWDVEVKDLGFDGLQSGASLAAGQCDLVASAMTITEEREANLDFSEAYYDSKQSLLAPAAAGVASLDDLVGQKLGVQQGTTGAEYAEDNVPDGVELVAYPSDAELYAAVESGGVAAVLQDLPVNLAHTDDGAFEIVEQYDTGEQYGFAVKEEGSEELLDLVNKQLDALRADGTYDEIYASYFGA